MRIGRRLSAIAGAALVAMSVGSLALVQPATAADTTTTFEIEAGALSVSVPGAVNLGHVVTGSTTVSASMGNVTVADARSIVVATWTTTVTTSTFVNGTTIIPTTDVSYSAPAGTVSGAGTGTATGTALSAIGTGKTAQSFTGTLATSTVWNPTLSIAITGASAGAYTGTVTHSVV